MLTHSCSPTLANMPALDLLSHPHSALIPCANQLACPHWLACVHMSTCFCLPIPACCIPAMKIPNAQCAVCSCVLQHAYCICHSTWIIYMYMPWQGHCKYGAITSASGIFCCYENPAHRCIHELLFASVYIKF